MNHILTILCALCLLTTQTAKAASLQARNGPFFLVEQLRPCPDCLSLQSCQLYSEQIIQAFLAAKAGSQMAEDLIGLSVLYYYNTAAIQTSAQAYNVNISLLIESIREDILCLGKGTKEAADFITTTLVQLNAGVNQLIIDSADETTDQAVIEADYYQLQVIVNNFNAGFGIILPNAANKAGCSLASFVDNIESYISQITAIVFDGAMGNSLLLSTEYNAAVSLRSFVRDAVYAVALTTKPCPIYRDKILQFLKIKDKCYAKMV